MFAYLENFLVDLVNGLDCVLELTLATNPGALHLRDASGKEISSATQFSHLGAGVEITAL